MTTFQQQSQPTRSQQSSSAALGAALAAVNPYLGALYGVTNFLFGQGGFSPRALSADVGSLTISDINRALKLPAVSPPPVRSVSGSRRNDDYGAVWDSTRAFYAAQNFPAQAGLPATPPPEFVAAWNKYSSTSNPGEAEVGWARYAELVKNTRAAGYQAPEWGDLFASTPSNTRKTGDYLGLAASVAPAVLDFLKPATVKPIPTGGPNPGVPQMAFVGAIPEIVVTAARVAPPAIAWTRAAIAARAAAVAAALGIGGSTAFRGPKPLPFLQPMVKPPAVKPVTKPPVLPPQLQPQLAPPQLIQEVVVTTTPVRSLAFPPISLGSAVGVLTPTLATLAPQITALRATVAQAVTTPTRLGTRAVTALAPALAPLLAPAVAVPAVPKLGRLRLPAVPVLPGFPPMTPQLATATATAAGTTAQRCTCTDVDNSPKAKRERKEKREKRKRRRCFSSSQSLSAYVRKQINRRK